MSLFVPDMSDTAFHIAEFGGHEVAADPHGVAAYASAIMAGAPGVSSGRSVEDIAAPMGGPDISGGRSL